MRNKFSFISIFMICPFLFSCSHLTPNKDDKPLFACHASIVCFSDGDEKYFNRVGLNRFTQCNNIHIEIEKYIEKHHKDHPVAINICRCTDETPDPD